MTWGVTAVVGGTLVSGYLGGEAAEGAAETSADASRYAADLQQQQYEQARQDLDPYRAVATGGAVPASVDPRNAATIQYLSDRGYDANYISGQLEGISAEDVKSTMDFQKYGGGALGELADYGRSRVLEGDYIPSSEIPEYQRSQVGGLPAIRSDMPEFDVRGDIRQFDVRGDVPTYDVQRGTAELRAPEFDVRGDIPEFDATQFDLYKDPGYEFRKSEMERGVNRAAAGMGKVTSGNRLEEIMARSGEMASQEYGAARGRMLEDYGIRRGVEQEQYGRDVGAYEQDYRRAGDIYGADYQRMADLYGADVAQYEAGRQREADIYGRDVYGYGQQRTAETEQYGRDIGAYGIQRGAETEQYGRGVDEYGRAYARDVDQYGRDLTAYNAEMARENMLYGRGVDAYGRAYGEESDYLNRMSSLANIGQTATAQTAQAGSQYATGAGSAIQAAGQAQAAGQIGQAAAWQQGIGDMTSLYTMNQVRQPTTYATEYSPVTSQYYGY